MVVAVLALTVPVASAAEPDTQTFEVSGSINIDGICAFPIQFDYVATGTVTAFFDDSGLLVARERHVVETDTLSANGKTAVGTAYRGNIRATYDSAGNTLSLYASGQVEKLTLPDGSSFFSVGRVDFLDDGNPAFTPNVGRSGDIAALCAALA
jgi:hypothetical protein